MTVYTAPPNTNGLVLNQGDELKVQAGGTAYNTIVNLYGLEDVYNGGASVNTTVTRGGGEFVHSGGVSNFTSLDGGYEHLYSGGISRNTTVSDGGAEYVDRFGVSYGTKLERGGSEYVREDGVSNSTVIGTGGVERVDGLANDTIIDAGGREQVFVDGQAHNVTFAGARALLQLENPTGLTGVLSGWRIGDTIDLQRTHVHSVSETGNVLTVNYGNNQTVEYTLANQQADTHVAFHSDGRGGTDLVLATGVQPLTHHDLLV